MGCCRLTSQPLGSAWPGPLAPLRHLRRHWATRGSSGPVMPVPRIPLPLFPLLPKKPPPQPIAGGTARSIPWQVHPSDADLTPGSNSGLGQKKEGKAISAPSPLMGFGVTVAEPSWSCGMNWVASPSTLSILPLRHPSPASPGTTELGPAPGLFVQHFGLCSP